MCVSVQLKIKTKIYSVTCPELQLPELLKLQRFTGDFRFQEPQEYSVMMLFCGCPDRNSHLEKILASQVF